MLPVISGDRRTERRRAHRTPKPGKVKFSWNTEGRERVAQGELLDLSASGMRLLVRDALRTGTAVRFQADDAGLHGSAVVRHCVQKGLKYIVGAEFLGGLAWKSAETAK